MVFSTTNLFKGIPCPEGVRCKLTNCIYGHEPQSQAAETPGPAARVTAPKATPSSNGIHMPSQSSADQQNEPAAKRRRVTYETLADKPLSRAEQIKADLEATRSAKGADVSPPSQSHLKPVASTSSNGSTPASLARPVSPPAAGGVRPTLKQTTPMPASVTMNKPEPAITEPTKAAPVKKE
jgi:RNA exonuclease 1